jgi:hypothetical protein
LTNNRTTDEFETIWKEAVTEPRYYPGICSEAEENHENPQKTSRKIIAVMSSDLAKIKIGQKGNHMR